MSGASKNPSEAEGHRKIELEYVKLWMEQSKLFWSRLQTAAAIQTGTFVGFYKISTSDKVGIHFLNYPLLTLAIGLLVLIIRIMMKDAEYSDALARSSGFSFPAPENRNRAGKYSGYCIMFCCILSNLFLFLYLWLPIVP